MYYDQYEHVRQQRRILKKFQCDYPMRDKAGNDHFKEEVEWRWKNLQTDAIRDQYMSHLELISIDEYNSIERYGMTIVITYYEVYANESMYNAMLICR